MSDLFLGVVDIRTSSNPNIFVEQIKYRELELTSVNPHSGKTPQRPRAENFPRRAVQKEEQLKPRNTFSSILENNGGLLFLLFCMVFWLFSFANDEFIATDALFEQYVEEQRQEKYDDYDELAAEFEDDIDDFEDDEEYWTDYLWDLGFSGIFNLIRFSIVAGFLFAALSIASSAEMRFGSIFKVVVVAKFIFVIPAIVKLLWFYFFDTDYTYTDVQDFRPFSVLALLDTENLSLWIVLTLKEVDLFQFIYGDF